MTSSTTPVSDSEPGAIEQADATVLEPTAKQKPAIKPFAFPFSAKIFAPSKSDDQPWHQKGNKSAHEKRIGPAPSGTRRSMGKR